MERGLLASILLREYPNHCLKEIKEISVDIEKGFFQAIWEFFSFKQCWNIVIMREDLSQTIQCLDQFPKERVEIARQLLMLVLLLHPICSSYLYYKANCAPDNCCDFWMRLNNQADGAEERR